MADKFRSISVSEDDYQMFEKIRSELNKESGLKLSIAQVVRLGMTFYGQRRKFIKTDGAETLSVVRDSKGRFVKDEEHQTAS